jgi:hypothetical protein
MDFYPLQVNIAIETTYVLKVRIKNFAFYIFVIISF